MQFAVVAAYAQLSSVHSIWYRQHRRPDENAAENGRLDARWKINLTDIRCCPTQMWNALQCQHRYRYCHRHLYHLNDGYLNINTKKMSLLRWISHDISGDGKIMRPRTAWDRNNCALIAKWGFTNMWTPFFFPNYNCLQIKSQFNPHSLAQSNTNEDRISFLTDIAEHFLFTCVKCLMILNTCVTVLLCSA